MSFNSELVQNIEKSDKLLKGLTKPSTNFDQMSPDKSDRIDEWVSQNISRIGIGTCTCVYVLKKTVGSDVTGIVGASHASGAEKGVNEGDVVVMHDVFSEQQQERASSSSGDDQQKGEGEKTSLGANPSVEENTEE